MMMWTLTIYKSGCVMNGISGRRSRRGDDKDNGGGGNNNKKDDSEGAQGNSDTGSVTNGDDNGNDYDGSNNNNNNSSERMMLTFNAISIFLPIVLSMIQHARKHDASEDGGTSGNGDGIGGDKNTMSKRSRKKKVYLFFQMARA